MKCPRCGGDMSNGVCEECGFPENVKVFMAKYIYYRSSTE